MRRTLRRALSMRAVVSLFENYQHLTPRQVQDEAGADATSSTFEKALAVKMLARIGDWRRALACLDGAIPPGTRAADEARLDAVFSFLDDFPPAVAARLREPMRWAEPPAATSRGGDGIGADGADADVAAAIGDADDLGAASSGPSGALAAVADADADVGLAFDALRDTDILRLALQPAATVGSGDAVVTSGEVLRRSTQGKLLQQLLAVCHAHAARATPLQRNGGVAPNHIRFNNSNSSNQAATRVAEPAANPALFPRGVWALSLVMCHWAQQPRLRSAAFEAAFVEGVYQDGLWLAALRALLSLPPIRFAPLMPVAVTTDKNATVASDDSVGNAQIFQDALQHQADVAKTAVERTGWVHALSFVLPALLRNVQPPTSASWVATWTGITAAVASLRVADHSGAASLRIAAGHHVGDPHVLSRLVSTVIEAITRDVATSRACGLTRDAARYTMIVDLLSGVLATRPDSMRFASEVVALLRLVVSVVGEPATSELILAAILTLPFSSALFTRTPTASPAAAATAPPTPVFASSAGRAFCQASHKALAVCEAVLAAPDTQRWEVALGLAPLCSVFFPAMSPECLLRALLACARGRGRDLFGYTEWETALRTTDTYLRCGVRPDAECHFYLVQFGGARSWEHALHALGAMRSAGHAVKAGVARAVMFYLHECTDWRLVLSVFDGLRLETTVGVQATSVAIRAASLYGGQWEIAIRLMGDMCRGPGGGGGGPAFGGAFPRGAAAATGHALRALVEALLEQPTEQTDRAATMLQKARVIEGVTRNALGVAHAALLGDTALFHARVPFVAANPHDQPSQQESTGGSNRVGAGAGGGAPRALSAQAEACAGLLAATLQLSSRHRQHLAFHVSRLLWEGGRRTEYGVFVEHVAPRFFGTTAAVRVYNPERGVTKYQGPSPGDYDRERQRRGGHAGSGLYRHHQREGADRSSDPSSESGVPAGGGGMRARAPESVVREGHHSMAKKAEDLLDELLGKD